MMKASYKKLWKLLVDKEMSKSDLHKATGLSSSTMTKLRRSEDVSMEALRKICTVLDCNIADIVIISSTSLRVPAGFRKGFFRLVSSLSLMSK